MSYELYRDLFDTYTSCDSESIVMANNVECRSIGKGRMKIKMFDGVVQTLTNVMHVPDLKKELNFLYLGL